jgi:hypothetical protein
MSLLDRWRSLRGPSPSESTDPELAALLQRASALTRASQPTRDLWSGIENRIALLEQAATSHPAGRTALASLFPRPALAAAVALVLVATTAATTLWVAGQNAEPLSDADVRAIAERVRQRDGVSGVHDSLTRMLEARRGDLPDETLAGLEANLLAIDRAIAEIHVALEAHPDDHGLSFLLAEAYRREADLLDRIGWWLRAPEEATS